MVLPPSGKIPAGANGMYMYCFQPAFTRVSQSHSSVEKAGLVGAVTLHCVTSDAHAQLRGDALSEAIESDKAKGLIPFYVSQYT